MFYNVIILIAQPSVSSILGSTTASLFAAFIIVLIIATVLPKSKLGVFIDKLLVPPKFVEWMIRKQPEDGTPANPEKTHPPNLMKPETTSLDLYGTVL